MEEAPFSFRCCKLNLKSGTYIELARIISQCYAQPQLFQSSSIAAHKVPSPGKVDQETRAASERRLSEQVGMVDPELLDPCSFGTPKCNDVGDVLNLIGSQHKGLTDTDPEVINEIEQVMKIDEDESLSKRTGLHTLAFSHAIKFRINELEHSMKENTTQCSTPLGESRSGCEYEDVTHEEESLVTQPVFMKECNDAIQQPEKNECPVESRMMTSKTGGPAKLEKLAGIHGIVDYASHVIEDGTPEEGEIYGELNGNEKLVDMIADVSELEMVAKQLFESIDHPQDLFLSGKVEINGNDCSVKELLGDKCNVNGSSSMEIKERFQSETHCNHMEVLHGDIVSGEEGCLQLRQKGCSFREQKKDSSSKEKEETSIAKISVDHRTCLNNFAISADDSCLTSTTRRKINNKENV